MPLSLLLCRQSWSDELSPLLSVARTKLSERLVAHKDSLERARIHPAAHLDPGPEGYDIYGGVGQSLAMSLVSTRAGRDENVGVRNGLERARSLRCLYLSQRASLNKVVEAYHDALDQCKDADLLTQAMSELGDLLLSTNTRYSPQSHLATFHHTHAHSSQWWAESLCLLLGVRDPLTQWRQRCSSTTLVTSLGLTGCLLAGQLAYKLARYVLHAWLVQCVLAFPSGIVTVRSWMSD